jgi:hypothetical protein
MLENEFANISEGLRPENALEFERLTRQLIHLRQEQVKLLEQLADIAVIVRVAGVPSGQIASSGWDDNLMPSNYIMESIGKVNFRRYELFPMRFNYVRLKDGSKVSLVAKLSVRRVYLPYPYPHRQNVYFVAKTSTSEPVADEGKTEFTKEQADDLAHRLNVELLNQETT